MPQFNFGTGNLYYTPVGGGAPIAFGAIQSVSVDFSGDTKMLYGQNSFPLDTARGKVKIEGKASFGKVDLDLYNALFFNGTVVAGQTVQAFNEAGAIPATPYQVTVANAATFKTDLGVNFATTGLPLKQVASAPATGQYSVNTATGVYTFAAADTGKAVVLNYSYGDTVNGRTLTVTNPLMGAIPTFQVVLSGVSKGKSNFLTLLSCTSNKLSLPFKQDDYSVPEIDFSAQDNGSGQVMIWSATQG